MDKYHHYKLTTSWTGNKGSGTSNYKAYDRSYHIVINGKQTIEGSSDPAFRGDPSKHNPEEMLLGALSSCHMLWYLHLCAEAGVVVVNYTDEATGKMVETTNGGGKFEEVILNPKVTVTEAAMVSKANHLHRKASELCFIANSVNFPVNHHPVCLVQ